jgi:hypothetical protein
VMATQVAPSPMQAAMMRASNVPNSSRTAYSVRVQRLRYVSASRELPNISASLELPTSSSYTCCGKLGNSEQTVKGR